MKTVALYLVEHAGEYEAVYAPTISHLPLHYLFHARNFDFALAGRFGRDSVIDTIDNIHFNAEKCPSDFLDFNTLPIKSLIVDRIECGAKTTLKDIVTIKRADGHDAYVIKAFIQE
jgi:hypothetical protein